MNIILTGQSGQSKTSFVDAVKKVASERNISLSYETIGKIMLKKLGQKFGEHNILNLPKSNLDLLRSFACEQIMRLLEKDSSDYFIINTHAVFRWQHGLFPCLDLDFVLEIQPDMVVCIIDDILSVKIGLQARNTDIFNLWELFAWREEEIWVSKFITESVCKILKKEIPFYIFPRTEGPEIFFNLISKRDVPKVYISFPITGVHGEEKEEIEKFKESIKTNFIVFDPYAIKDRELTLTYYTLQEEISEFMSKIIIPESQMELFETKRWYPHIDELTPLALTKLRFSCDLPGRELLSVIRAIDSQIISRDYLLIDQSDFVVMYIKEDNGNPRISAGCQAELIHAYENGKPVFVIYRGGERKLSPFITQYSRLFENVGNCLAFLLDKK